ncbi:hypothetical protein F8568_044040 [Actinomadura sp. LD22]|uniref:Uncharacterized protein n=1 Tax=Actinomadura physcomitrii TaxID=2650748 RepID=A0A6I4MR18_9ACTN|nr:hypothetical protein [Actinomadura physcomitrii]MWA07195.1 hypothetical protein [Actinomadura physcomitrii]
MGDPDSFDINFAEWRAKRYRIDITGFYDPHNKRSPVMLERHRPDDSGRIVQFVRLEKSEPAAVYSALLRALDDWRQEPGGYPAFDLVSIDARSVSSSKPMMFNVVAREVGEAIGTGRLEVNRIPRIEICYEDSNILFVKDSMFEDVQGVLSEVGNWDAQGRFIPWEKSGLQGDPFGDGPFYAAARARDMDAALKETQGIFAHFGKNPLVQFNARQIHPAVLREFNTELRALTLDYPKIRELKRFIATWQINRAANLAYATEDSIILNANSWWNDPAKLAELGGDWGGSLARETINHEAGHLLTGPVMKNPEALKELNKTFSSILGLPIEITPGNLFTPLNPFRKNAEQIRVIKGYQCNGLDYARVSPAGSPEVGNALTGDWKHIIDSLTWTPENRVSAASGGELSDLVREFNSGSALFIVGRDPRIADLVETISSRYGSKNFDEMLAELFMELRSSNLPRPPAKMLGGIIDRYNRAAPTDVRAVGSPKGLPPGTGEPRPSGGRFEPFTSTDRPAGATGHTDARPFAREDPSAEAAKPHRREGSSDPDRMKVLGGEGDFAPGHRDYDHQAPDFPALYEERPGYTSNTDWYSDPTQTGSLNESFRPQFVERLPNRLGSKIQEFIQWRAERLGRHISPTGQGEVLLERRSPLDPGTPIKYQRVAWGTSHSVRRAIHLALTDGGEPVMVLVLDARSTRLTENAARRALEDIAADSSLAPVDGIEIWFHHKELNDTACLVRDNQNLISLRYEHWHTNLRPPARDHETAIPVPSVANDGVLAPEAIEPPPVLPSQAATAPAAGPAAPATHPAPQPTHPGSGTGDLPDGNRPEPRGDVPAPGMHDTEPSRAPTGNHPTSSSVSGGANQPCSATLPTTAGGGDQPSPAFIRSDGFSLSPEKAALNQNILKVGRAYKGAFRWGGRSGPDMSSWEMEIGTTSDITALRNDFARYMLDIGPAPGRDGIMNCWEAILRIVHLAGGTDVWTLRRLHADAAAAARTAFEETIGDKALRVKAARNAFHDKIGMFLGPGQRTPYIIDPVTKIGGPDIPAGHIVFMDGMNHVAYSRGERDAENRSLVFSHFCDPNPGVFPSSGKFSFEEPGSIQKFGSWQETSIEELREYRPNWTRIESAIPSWLL